MAISSRGEPHVSFNLIDFYHNFSSLFGVDSYKLTARQVGEIAAELSRGFETGALKPPAIEIVPFEKAVDCCRCQRNFSDTPCILSANKQDNELKQQLR